MGTTPSEITSERARVSPALTLGDVARIVEPSVPLESTQLDLPVTGFAIDSRAVKPGQIFAAIKGQRLDGHHFVLHALAAGATGALVDATTPLGCTCHPIPDALAPVVGLSAGGQALPPQVERSLRARLLQVASVPEALQRLARAHRTRLPVPFVAVTGSSGKTTTKDVIATVLGVHRTVCASRGNLNSQLGMPLTLLSQLDESHQVGVFEVGMSARGEIARLCAILAPSMGVVTNVGPAHLEFLGSMEEVFKAKSELVESLPPDGRLYLNADDAYADRMHRMYPGKVRRVSLSNASADYLATGLVSGLAGLSGTIQRRSDGRCIPLRMPIPGRHMGYAALFAVAVAGDLGIDLPEATRALEGCKAAPHRMEVRHLGGVAILDDAYNANPASTRATIAFAATVYVRGRRIAVLGDMLELGDHGLEAHRSLIHEALASGIERLIFVGPLYARAAASVESKEPQMKALATFVDTRDAALDALKKEVSSGDLLILKGSRGIGLEELLVGLFGDQAASFAH